MWFLSAHETLLLRNCSGFIVMAGDILYQMQEARRTVIFSNSNDAKDFSNEESGTDMLYRPITP